MPDKKTIKKSVRKLVKSIGIKRTLKGAAKKLNEKVLEGQAKRRTRKIAEQFKGNLSNRGLRTIKNLAPAKGVKDHEIIGEVNRLRSERDKKRNANRKGKTTPGTRTGKFKNFP